MARAFAAASSQYLARSGAVVTAAPLTIAGWARPSDGNDRTVLSISQTGTENHFIVGTEGTLVLAGAKDGSGPGYAFASGGPAANVWRHVAGVFDSTTSRSAFVNGTGKTTNTTSVTPAGLNTTEIGRVSTSPAKWYFDGDLADVAIWNVALTDAEVAVLATGVSPLLVRPDALVAYYRLVEGYSPEIDLMRGNGLTVTGATVAGTHPAVAYPIGLHWNKGKPATAQAVAGALTPSGTVTAIKTSLQALAGSLTPAGSLAPRNVYKVLAGTLTPVGSLVKRIARALAGALTPSGALSKVTDDTFLVTINGTDRTAYFDRHSMEIVDDDKELPNTATLEAFGFTPVVNDAIIIYVGFSKEFAGRITRIKERHDKLTKRVVKRCECIDWTWDLKGVLINASYGSQSASTTAAAILASAPVGFTTSIEASLATVAAIQFKQTTLPDALSQLCDAFGGGWYVDEDKVIRVFTSDVTATPATLDTSNRDFRQFSYEKHIDELFNRICIEGAGSSCRAARAVGDTTIPLDDASMFASGGGSAIVANQILTYTGKQAGGTGSTVVGPLQSPSAPSASKTTGGGRIQGTVTYKAAFVLGARGESEVGSASGSVAGTAVNAPSQTPLTNMTPATSGGFMADGSYYYVMTFVTGVVSFNGVSISGETGYSNGGSTTISGGGGNGKISHATVLTSGDGRVVARRFYRSRVNQSSGPYYYVGTISDNTTTTFVDTVNDSGLGAEGPGATNTTGDTGALTSIPTGPSGTTARRLYRTEAGGSTYRYLATIADNTTTTYTDTKADSDLGDVAPDKSQVTTLAGATALRVADLAQFVSAGGWARVSGQVVRYTGRSASSGEGTLTGIPASGVGSLVSNVSFDTEVLALPFLLGIPSSSTGSIVTAIPDGEAISLYVERNDTTSQGTYGIRRLPLQDRRLSIEAANALGDAKLTLHKDPRENGTYLTNDSAVKSGRALSISLAAAWGVSGTYKITKVRKYFDPHRVSLERFVTYGNQTADRDLYRILRGLQRDIQSAG